MRIPLFAILSGLTFMMVSSCGEKEHPAPEVILDSVGSVRKYAESFVGLKVEDAKMKLSPALVIEEEWVDEDIVDGKYLSVEYDEYDLLLMCHDGSVIMASISVDSSD